MWEMFGRKCALPGCIDHEQAVRKEAPEQTVMVGAGNTH